MERSATSTSSARRSTARAGFSLAELIGVIAILAMIAAMVTVNWAALMPKTQLHSAVRSLAATLQSARSEAITRKALFEVEYDLEGRRFRTVTPFRAEGGGLAFVAEDRRALAWENLPESVEFARIEIDGQQYVEGIVRVRFDALGTATTHVITLVQKQHDAYYTIEVQGLLGLIDYREGQFKRTPPKEADFE